MCNNKLDTWSIHNCILCKIKKMFDNCITFLHTIFTINIYYFSFLSISWFRNSKKYWINRLNNNSDNDKHFLILVWKSWHYTYNIYSIILHFFLQLNAYIFITLCNALIILGSMHNIKYILFKLFEHNIFKYYRSIFID